MILFVFTGQAPPILFAALLILAYLTGVELWQREGPAVPWSRRGGCCSCSSCNIFGYAVFRVWLALRRRSSDNGSQA